MKIIRFTLLLIGLFVILQSGFGQEMTRFKGNEIGITIGISQLGIQDDRISAISKSGKAPVFGINYKSISPKTKQEWSISFMMANHIGDDQLLTAKVIRPNVSYSYERKIKQIWFGGFFDSSTILHFPRTNTRHFENNPISYTISQSLGPKISMNQNFGNNNQWEFGTAAQFSLLNYVIRPAYGHPYPEKYVESGTFHPTRRNMTGPLLRSGKLHSFDKFQSFKVVFGISYFLSDQIKVSIRYQISQLKTKDLQQSKFSTQEILFGINYHY